MFIIDPYRFGSGAGDGLADVIATQPAIALAFWNLYPATYSGNCLLIERASDLATQAIGFDGGGVLDTAAIASFCGASNGHIASWYNQRDGTVGAFGHYASNRCKIYDGGTGQMVRDASGKIGWEMGNPAKYNYMVFASSPGTQVTMMARFATSDTNFVIFGADNNNEYLGSAVSGDTSTVVCNDGGVFSVGTHFRNGSKLTVTNRATLYTQLNTGSGALRYAVKNAMNYAGDPSFGIYNDSVTNTVSMNNGYFTGYGLYYPSQLPDADIASVDTYLAANVP